MRSSKNHRNFSNHPTAHFDMTISAKAQVTSGNIHLTLASSALGQESQKVTLCLLIFLLTWGSWGWRGQETDGSVSSMSQRNWFSQKQFIVDLRTILKSLPSVALRGSLTSERVSCVFWEQDGFQDKIERERSASRPSEKVCVWPTELRCPWSPLPHKVWFNIKCAVLWFLLLTHPRRTLLLAQGSPEPCPPPLPSPLVYTRS